jgi:hypothetical protein
MNDQFWKLFVCYSAQNTKFGDPFIKLSCSALYLLSHHTVFPKRRVLVIVPGSAQSPQIREPLNQINNLFPVTLNWPNFDDSNPTLVGLRITNCYPNDDYKC